MQPLVDSFATLPVELIYEILTHAVVDSTQSGERVWAASLLTISRSVHDILRPVFYRKLVIWPSVEEGLLRFIPLQPSDAPLLRDVRELYSYHYLVSANIDTLISALVPSTLVVVDVPFPLVQRLAESSDFSPRNLSVQWAQFHRIQTLPRCSLRHVTHLATYLPDVGTEADHEPTWLEGAAMTEVLSALPALTHIAFRLSLPEVHAVTAWRFSDTDPFLEVFRRALAVGNTIRVALRVSGFYLKFWSKIVELLQSLRDERVFCSRDDSLLDTWDDYTSVYLHEALDDRDIWCVGHQVYSPHEASSGGSPRGERDVLRSPLKQTAH